MHPVRRGALAAFFFSSFLIAASPGFALAAGSDALAPGETTLPDGLTTEVRHATAAGSVAIEIWIRCPSDGWSDGEPGIARLAAFTVMDNRVAGSSMRDLVRMEGGDLAVSVFQTATEFAVLAPSYAAPQLEDGLLRRVFGASLDPAALEDAKTRLAEQQAEASQSSEAVLRDGVFAALFSAGPMHASTLGDARAIETTSIAQVRTYIARSYVPGNAILVAVGNADPDALMRAVVGAAPVAAQTSAVPPSMAVAPAAQATVKLAPSRGDVPGVALAWAGPPISDDRAATAMDFLSDYLADQRAGLLALAATHVDASAAFVGQFITLQHAGVFYASATGDGVDPQTMTGALRQSLTPILNGPIRGDEFDRALRAYQSRLLRQMDSPTGLADNYGWYFAEGAPGYSPSATDADLSGKYFKDATSLTPDFVHQVAQQYLSAPPAAVTVVPQPAPSIGVSTGGT